jgi:hypothetical protein
LFLVYQLTEHKLTRKEEGMPVDCWAYIHVHIDKSKCAFISTHWFYFLCSIFLSTEEAIRRSKAAEQDDMHALRFAIIYIYLGL